MIIASSGTQFMCKTWCLQQNHKAGKLRPKQTESGRHKHENHFDVELKLLGFAEEFVITNITVNEGN